MVSSEDTVERDGDRVVHLDCRRPRRLNLEERALLDRYCWDHAVGECESCARSFRQDELLTGLSADGTDLCPQCRKDLTDSVRAHLYGCTMLPAEVRRRAHDTRVAAQALPKQSGELQDRADVLRREAEVALATSRAASQSTTEVLRRLIQYKLRDGSTEPRPQDTPRGRTPDGRSLRRCSVFVRSSSGRHQFDTRGCDAVWVSRYEQRLSGACATMPSTILVIDNDIHVLATATDLLEVAGHRVLAAASGEQGVAMAMTVRPDLILVDRQMLMMNGFELLQQLKAGTVTSRIPVVALTSGTAQEANQRMQAGGIAFIPQPSEPAAFLRHIADILNVTVEQGRPRSDP